MLALGRLTWGVVLVAKVLRSLVGIVGAMALLTSRACGSA